MTRTRWRGALAAALLLGLAACCSSEEKDPPRSADTRSTERIAQGRPADIIPIVLAVLGGNPDFANVTLDGDAVVAEVRHIPGLGLALPAAECFLRIDFEKLENTTRLILSFYRLKQQLDSLAAQAVVGLFRQVLASMVKGGVVFK